jgi:hypothetical protein
MGDSGTKQSVNLATRIAFTQESEILEHLADASQNTCHTKCQNIRDKNRQIFERAHRLEIDLGGLMFHVKPIP